MYEIKASVKVQCDDEKASTLLSNLKMNNIHSNPFPFGIQETANGLLANETMTLSSIVKMICLKKTAATQDA